MTPRSVACPPWQRRRVLVLRDERPGGVSGGQVHGDGRMRVGTDDGWRRVAGLTGALASLHGWPFFRIRRAPTGGDEGRLFFILRIL